MDQIWLKMNQKGLRIGLKELRIVYLDQKYLFMVELGVPLSPLCGKNPPNSISPSP